MSLGAQRQRRGVLRLFRQPRSERLRGALGVRALLVARESRVELNHRLKFASLMRNRFQFNIFYVNNLETMKGAAFQSESRKRHLVRSTECSTVYNIFFFLTNYSQENFGNFKCAVQSPQPRRIRLGRVREGVPRRCTGHPRSGGRLCIIRTTTTTTTRFRSRLSRLLTERETRAVYWWRTI